MRSSAPGTRAAPFEASSRFARRGGIAGEAAATGSLIQLWRQHSMTSFERVREREQRLAQMQQQIAELSVEEQALGTEIAVTLAAGQDATKPRGRRAELRQLRADLKEAAALLEVQLTTDREKAGRTEAEARMKAIGRAHGSLRAQLDADEGSIGEAVAAYAAAVTRLNERYRSLLLLKAEAEALADRFGVAAPALPNVVVPVRRERCTAAAVVAARAEFGDRSYVRPATEEDEHHLMTRRTYKECDATEGYRIIIAAGGPKPWPELTAKQSAIVASRAEQQARVAADAPLLAAEAARAVQRHWL